MSKSKKMLSVLLTVIMLLSVFCALPIVSNAAQCEGFEYVVIDDGTIEIVKYGGSSKEVNVPDNIQGIKVTSIGEYAFSKCTNIVSVNLPESIVKIGISSFSYCTNLESITIPNNVKSIEYYAFSGCTKLSNINLTNKNLLKF